MNIFQGKIIAIIVLIISSYLAYSHYLTINKVTAIPFLDRIITTSEFLENDALQKKVIDYCGNNPGELNKDANCINAKSAMLTASGGSGKGNFPSYNLNSKSNK